MKQKFLLVIVFCLLTATISAQTKEASKFDEFGELPCDDLQSRLGNLATALGSNKYFGSVALIYLYEGKHVADFTKERDAFLPKFGESVARTRAMRELLSRSKYDQRNFIFANGGFREKYMVEVWIVPKGAKLPKATPTLETMKYRKGTPTYSCREF